MARIKEFPDVAKEILGSDVNDSDFDERIQELVARRKSALSHLRFKAQQAKPLSKGEATKYMRTYIKNMSGSYYSTGRIMEWANSFKGAALTVEYEKIKATLEKSTSKPSTDLPRGGSSLDDPSSKRSKPSSNPPLVHAAPLDVPAEPSVSAASTIPINVSITKESLPKEQSSLRRSTRKKQLGRKKAQTSSSIPTQPDDPDALYRQHIRFSSEASDEEMVVYVPMITNGKILAWAVVPQGVGVLHTLHFQGGYTKSFTYLKEILPIIDKQSLSYLYRLVDAYVKRNQS